MNVKKNPEKKMFSFASAMIAILFFCAIAASCQNVPESNASIESDGEMLFMLLQIQAGVQGNLTDLDSDMANAAQNLSETGLNGTAASEILLNLLETNSNIAETSTFSKEGKIIVAEGKESESAEGADISNQEHIAHVLKAKTPTFSKQLRLIEGYNGTVLDFPVFSPQGEFIGGIAAIIEPYKLMNDLVSPKFQSGMNNTDYSIWLMHLDGLIAYDKHPSEIGKYLFEDPLYKPYPSLLALGKKMVAERSGHGYYSFPVTEGNNTVVTKETYWTTVGLHGREWRLAITKVI